MKYYAPTKLSENISETPEGYLLCLAVPIARTGVMEYGKGETPLEVGKDGIVRISRAPEEVFRPETIASFEGKPFTIKHPEDFVDPENWKDLAKGVMQNVRRGEGDDKDNLVADILITDSFAISLVKNGLRGLSCGYEAEYTQTGEGTGKQSNILGNHLALVEEGRAGSQYAINDSKGASMKNKTLVERMKKAFGFALDEAMKEEDAAPAAGEKKPDDKSKDEGAMDEVKKLVGDLVAKLNDMAKPKDEEKPAEGEKKPEEKNEDAPDLAKIEERLKACEAALAKLMEGESEAGDEDEEEAGDDEDEGEAEDEEGEEADDAAMCGDVADTASRAEILAPGIKGDAKDIKVRALKASYATADGKKVIDNLTGGKAPKYDSKDNVETLFVAASEVLKASRGVGLPRTKVNDFQSTIFTRDGEMTPEKMNEINAKHFGKQA